jgi:hypothetical protein
MDSDRQFYVYLHKDPTTGEVVYVGKGKYGRAWDVTRCRTKNQDHQNWMKELCLRGFVPTDWVELLFKNLTENEAFQHEKEYLHRKGTLKFNKQSGQNQHQSKMTNEQARQAYVLASKGVKHKTIADLFNVSRSAISMLASGKQWKAVTFDLRGEVNV